MKLQVGFLFLSYSTLFDWLSNQIKVVTDNDHVVERNWRAQSKNDPLIFRPFLKVFRSSWQLLLKTFKNGRKIKGSFLLWAFQFIAVNIQSKTEKIDQVGIKDWSSHDYWCGRWHKLQTWCTHPPLDKGSSLLFKNIFHLLWIPKCFFLWFALDSWGFGYGRCSRIGERFKAKRWEDY